MKIVLLQTLYKMQKLIKKIKALGYVSRINGILCNNRRSSLPLGRTFRLANSCYWTQSLPRRMTMVQSYLGQDSNAEDVEHLANLGFYDKEGNLNKFMFEHIKDIIDGAKRNEISIENWA